MLNNLFDLSVEVFKITIVHEDVVGHLHASPDVLMIRVSGGHFTLFVFDKGLVRDMVSFGTAPHNPLVADFRVGIHTEEQKMVMLTQ